MPHKTRMAKRAISIKNSFVGKTEEIENFGGEKERKLFQI
tara:strand:+ start:376347 stop:376466 length:120 start_codon:yes stop_codon:yes gene_type:complete